jgi:streptogramin lyase
VTVTSASAPALVTKVFSDAQGRYRVPDLGAGVHVNSLYVKASRIGYRQVSPTSSAVTDLRPALVEGAAKVDLVLEAVPDVSDQVPASAWLGQLADGPERQRTVVLCTQCHQMPSPRVKRFAATLADQPPAVRVEAWRAIIKMMRTVGIYGALQAEHAAPLPMEELAKPEQSMFSQADEDVLAPYLAQHFPTRFDSYPAADVTHLQAPMGVNDRTVIREYPWPEGSFVRETAVVDGQVWVCDIARNRLGWLDPASGAYRWHDVPLPGAPAPHTLVPDTAGNIWMTMLGHTGQMAARFTPASGQWRIYDGFPVGHMAHDLSPGPAYRMAFDPKGFGWLTVISHNQVVGFHRDTGEVTDAYDLPLPAGENPIHVSVYGGALSPDGHYWYAQYFGNVGRFNTQTRKVDHVGDLPSGSGPHRTVLDENGVLYVSLIGAGQVLAYDTRALKEIGRITLPDTASAPYDVMYDPSRKALWMGTVNNDRLFPYDLESRRFSEYPLGIAHLNLRIIAIDARTGDLWIANSPIPANEPDGRRVFMVHPGDR